MKFCSPCATNGAQGKQVSQKYITPKSLENRPRYFNWIKPCFKVLVINFRGLFSDKKTISVDSNGLSQVDLSSPLSDSGNRKAYKACLKLSIETRKTQTSKRRCRSKYCRMAMAKF